MTTVDVNDEAFLAEQDAMQLKSCTNICYGITLNAYHLEQIIIDSD